jgi:hypothetical protein
LAAIATRATCAAVAPNTAIPSNDLAVAAVASSTSGAGGPTGSAITGQQATFPAAAAGPALAAGPAGIAIAERMLIPPAVAAVTADTAAASVATTAEQQAAITGGATGATHTADRPDTDRRAHPIAAGSTRAASTPDSPQPSGSTGPASPAGPAGNLGEPARSAGATIPVQPTCGATGTPDGTRRCASPVAPVTDQPGRAADPTHAVEAMAAVAPQDPAGLTVRVQCRTTGAIPDQRSPEQRVGWSIDRSE